MGITCGTYRSGLDEPVPGGWTWNIDRCQPAVPVGGAEFGTEVEFQHSTLISYFGAE